MKTIESPLPLIPADRLYEWIGKPVHVIGTRRGCVWILKDVVNTMAFLITPTTGREIKAHISNLYATRRQVEVKRMLDTPPINRG